MLQRFLHDFVRAYPKPGQPPTLALTVGTHDRDRDTSKFRLSDAGKCRLMRYWKRQGKPGTNTIPPEAMLQMQIGNMLHAYIERALDWIGVLVASEELLEDEHRIGHFDMVTQYLDDCGMRVLYDIKSINSKRAYFMERDGNRADPQHIMQLVSYADMYPGPLDILRLAYVVRDTLEIREIEIFPENHHYKIEKDWQTLINAWISQQEPAANPSEWECKYCQYNFDCPQKRG